MKKKLKGFYLLLSSLFISLLHLPFAFAKSASGSKLLTQSVAIPPSDSSQTIIPVKSVYDSLHLDIFGLSRQAYEYAQRGLQKLISQGRVVNESIIAIADFSQPSSKKRLYVLDIKHYKMLFNTLVAHGKNSGKEWASSFSNKPFSRKSSPGFYITGETYMGNNGYSLKLIGMENGINDKAYKRAIVIHGAGYVNESYINGQGYIGRSEGCPALPQEEAGKIIDSIKDGACFFVYSPGKQYVSHSSMLR